MKDIIVKTARKVLTIQLNRPHRLNAMSFDMAEQIISTAKSIPDEITCILVTGTDRSFSTGRDLKDSRNHSKSEAKAYLKACIDSCLALQSIKIPTVACISGYAFGWGLELALSCDLRIVHEDTVLCFPETSLGLFPGATGTVTAARLIGSSKAKELIFTAEHFSGSQAFSM